MAVLTKSELLKEIRAKRIRITPYRPANLGPASYDLCLGAEFRFFKKPHGTISVRESSDYRKITKLVRTKGPVTILPGQLVLAITEERIMLPEDICGWLQGRSRFARLGLVVHITAAFMQPGIDNRQVLELFNAGPSPLVIRPGLRICQFIFERCEGKGKYRGRFRGQRL